MKDVEPQKPANTSERIVPAEVMITLSINGQLLRFPWKLTRLAIFHHLPDWLRTSSAKPPQPQKGEKFTLSPDVMVAIRSRIKAMARPILPKLKHGLNGPNVRLPAKREDTLPMLVFLLIDFILLECYQNPLEVTYDEATGMVTGVRSGQRSVSANDAAQPNGGASPGGDTGEA